MTDQSTTEIPYNITNYRLLPYPYGSENNYKNETFYTDYYNKNMSGHALLLTIPTQINNLLEIIKKNIIKSLE
jgi:hypothetical protein